MTDNNQAATALSQSTQSRKKPTLPRRPRLRDWPLRGYSYHVEIIGDLPEWVNLVGAKMRQCWNDMTGEMRRALKPINEEEKSAFENIMEPADRMAKQKEFDQRKREAIKPFKDTKFLRAIAQKYKGILPSDCYYRIADRFQKTIQNAPQRRSLIFQLHGYAPFECGLPRFKEKEDPGLHIPVIFNAVAGEETTFADLYTEGVKVSLWRKVEASTFGGNCEYTLKRPLGREGAWTPIRLNIKFNRLPPMNAIVKGVTLIRYKEIETRWSINFTLELPHIPVTPKNSPAGTTIRAWYRPENEEPRPVILNVIEWLGDGSAVYADYKGERGAWKVDHLSFGRRLTGRVAGCDSAGWRKFDDRIRVIVVTDNAGHSYEASVPLNITTSKEQRQRKWREAHGYPDRKLQTWDDYHKQTGLIGQAVQATKEALKEIYARNHAQWPEEARQAMTGLVKMQQGGLQRLHNLLAGHDEQAITVLDAWQAGYKELSHWKRVFELFASDNKEDVYRKISVWMAQNFDVIAWEGDARMMKQMAEAPSGDYAIQASQEYRQIAGQSTLRSYIRQASDKWGADLKDYKAAYSTRICPECGGEVPKSGKLLLTCENGHKMDQDVLASRNLLNWIPGVASISAEPVAIPPDLRKYLRLISVHEAKKEVI